MKVPYRGKVSVQLLNASGKETFSFITEEAEVDYKVKAEKLEHSVLSVSLRRLTEHPRGFQDGLPTRAVIGFGGEEIELGFISVSGDQHGLSDVMAGSVDLAVQFCLIEDPSLAHSRA